MVRLEEGGLEGDWDLVKIDFRVGIFEIVIY